MAKVQKPSDSKCYTPLPEPFRIWEESRITRKVNELVLTTRAKNQATAGAPGELPIAQEKHDLSVVLTEMSAGLEVSTADQYSQDPQFKTNHLH
jgi:hypothetical protein